MSLSMKIAILVGSLFVALGPWLTDHAVHLIAGGTERLGAIGEALGIVGGVVLAWLGRSPIPRSEWTEERRNGN